jgi:hypothetical protein
VKEGVKEEVGGWFAAQPTSKAVVMAARAEEWLNLAKVVIFTP